MFWNKRHKIKSDYENELKVYRSENRKVMSEILTLNHSVNQSLKDFNNEKKVIDITYDVMAQYPIGQDVEINDKVSTILLCSNSKLSIFKTTFKQGGEIMTHIHSDCKETVKVVRGCMLEATTGERYADKQKVVYRAGEQHNPIALTDLELLVLLEKQG